MSIVPNGEVAQALTIDAGSGEILSALSLVQAPSETLANARKAAVALQEVIAKKKKPVIFKGEQYLEFEDWQTVGRFYGTTAKVVETNPVDVGNVHGFRAVAVALHDGREISRAEAYCLTDEEQWAKKPIFQLASMAQTRAAAKVLRNVFSWVVVLAGYRATPAEEMIPEKEEPKKIPPPQPKPQPKPQPQPKPEPDTERRPKDPNAKISSETRRELFDLARESRLTDEEFKAVVTRVFGGDGRTDQLSNGQAEQLRAVIVQLARDVARADEEDALGF